MKRPMPKAGAEAGPAQPAARSRYAHVNREVTDSVTETNVKVTAEAPAMAMGGLFQSFAHASGMMFENTTAAQQQQLALAQAASDIGIALLYRAAGVTPPTPANGKPPVEGTT